MNKYIFLALGLLIGFGAIAFLVTPKKINKSQQSPSPLQVSQSVPSPSPEIVTTSASQAEEIVISGNDFSFSPSSITLKEGEATKIRFKNIGKAPHNLVISELGISTKTIPAGQEDVIIVAAPKTGEYAFYCSVGAHKQMGMVGKMVVE